MPSQLPLSPPAKSSLDMIGRTPMLEVTRIDTGPCTLFLKLENQNPGGSIKDRMALTMVEAAEKDGRLKPGGTLVEATAGNTGLGLAQVAAAKGYKLILVIPDKMSREKVLHLRALGAEVRWTRSDVGKGHPEYYQDVAAAIADSMDNAIFINQFSNPANPLAHYTTTGPEILEQMGGDVDAIVVGVGSGGTLTGIGRYMRENSPKTGMVLADPAGSILCHYVETGELIEAGSWTVEGIGEDFIPDNAEMDLVRKAYSITDRESVETARMLLRKEGILAGSSSGTLLAAALKYCREQTEPQRVVSIVCDTGGKYLTKVFNDMWVADQGMLDRPLTGTLADLISTRYGEGGVVTIAPTDTLLTAYNRMRSSDVSQLPVIADGKLVGILDESDILDAVEGAEDRRAGKFKGSVGEAMTSRVNTLQASENLDVLAPIFDNGEVAVVMNGDAFMGLITRVDLINHLRLRQG
jgi:cystathionine beta-synthase